MQLIKHIVIILCIFIFIIGCNSDTETSILGGISDSDDTINQEPLCNLYNLEIEMEAYMNSCYTTHDSLYYERHRLTCITDSGGDYIHFLLFYSGDNNYITASNGNRIEMETSKGEEWYASAQANKYGYLVMTPRSAYGDSNLANKFYMFKCYSSN